MYYSTKTYDHNKGLSCCFRQPNATHSHCLKLHGYSLAFSFKFACSSLDDKNWAQDFGNLQELEGWLRDTFDHTWAIDANDPFLDEAAAFVEKTNIARLVVLPNGVGCERFAEYAYYFANSLMKRLHGDRVWCASVEVREHSGNSAIYSIE